MQLGTIIKGKFPTYDSRGTATHYALVFRVESDVGRLARIFAVVGTSQRVSRDGHTPTEFVLDQRDAALVESGLEKATKFDFNGLKFVVEDWMDAKVVGKITGRALTRRMVQAYAAHVTPQRPR